MHDMVEFFSFVLSKAMHINDSEFGTKEKYNPRIKEYPNLYIVRRKSSSLKALENVKALS